MNYFWLAAFSCSIRRQTAVFIVQGISFLALCSGRGGMAFDSAAIRRHADVFKEQAGSVRFGALGLGIAGLASACAFSIPQTAVLY